MRTILLALFALMVSGVVWGQETEKFLNAKKAEKTVKEIEESNSVASSGIGEIISIGLSWLVKFVEDKAKEHADEFYDHVKWKDYDNI